MEKIINAKIYNTFLGFEDHGIFTFSLDLEFESYHQGFGGYSLGGTDCSKILKELLNTIGVNEWNELKGSYIRVKYKSDEWNSPIYAIGNLIQNRWFTFEKE